MADADLPAALARRDWAAALTILRTTGGGLAPQAAQQWRAYVLFRSGDADAALAAYQTVDGDTRLPQAACLFQLRRYGEAQALAAQAADCSLRTHLLAHCAAKLGGGAAASDDDVAAWEAALAGGGIDDRLSLAALLYGRSEFGAAAELYESIQAQFPELHAVAAYRALCAAMEGDYEGAAALAAAYRHEHPDSLLAANIAANVEFRASGCAAALRTLPPHPPAEAAQQRQPAAALVAHNAVVFSGGAGGMQVLPPLVDVVPEARLNLVLLHCRRGDPARALALLRGLEPATAFEHICKGVASALHGQAAGSAAHVAEAVACFRAVGESPSEADSVPGRQYLASALLLGPRPGDAAPLLESVGEVCSGDDALSWNLGMARAAEGDWAGAAEALAAVQGPALVEDPLHSAWLSRCLARAGQPEEAWGVATAAQQRLGPAPAVAELLGLLGDELLMAGQPLWAARAFHALEHLRQQGAAGAAWDGLRAAAAALARAAVAGEPGTGAVLPELLTMLRGSRHPQALAAAAAVRQWMQQEQGGHAEEVAAGQAAEAAGA